MFDCSIKVSGVWGLRMRCRTVAFSGWGTHGLKKHRTKAAFLPRYKHTEFTVAILPANSPALVHDRMDVDASCLPLQLRASVKEFLYAHLQEKRTCCRDTEACHDQGSACSPYTLVSAAVSSRVAIHRSSVKPACKHMTLPTPGRGDALQIQEHKCRKTIPHAL